MIVQEVSVIVDGSIETYKLGGEITHCGQKVTVDRIDITDDTDAVQLQLSNSWVCLFSKYIPYVATFVPETEEESSEKG